MVRLPGREGEANVQHALELARFNTWSQLYLLPARDQATMDLEEMPSATSSLTTSQRLLRT